jgi:hypothetical protein
MAQARLADAVMKTQAFARGRNVKPLDLQFGGTHGYAPNANEWVSATKYVRKNLVVLAFQAPTGFHRMPNSEFMISAWKSLIETQAKRWEGFNRGLTIEWAETAVGGGGEKWHDWTKVTRAQTVPKCSVTDLAGRPVQNFLDDYTRYLIADPDTGIPMLSTIAGYKPDDQLADTYAGTILAYELDPTHTKVAKSWLVVNFAPKSGTGDIEGIRDMTAAGELKEFDIEWTGWAVSGLGIDAMAQTVVDGMQLANANPFLRRAHIEAVDAFVADNMAGGYKATMEDLGADTVMTSGA